MAQRTPSSMFLDQFPILYSGEVGIPSIQTCGFTSKKYILVVNPVCLRIENSKTRSSISNRRVAINDIKSFAFTPKGFLLTLEENALGLRKVPDAAKELNAVKTEQQSGGSGSSKIGEPNQLEFTCTQSEASKFRQEIGDARRVIQKRIKEYKAANANESLNDRNSSVNRETMGTFNQSPALPAEPAPAISQQPQIRQAAAAYAVPKNMNNNSNNGNMMMAASTAAKKGTHNHINADTKFKFNAAAKAMTAAPKPAPVPAPTAEEKEKEEELEEELEEEDEEEDGGNENDISSLVQELKEVLLVLDYMSSDLEQSMVELDNKYATTIDQLEKERRIDELDFQDPIIRQFQVVLFGLDIGCKDVTAILKEISDMENNMGLGEEFPNSDNTLSNSESDADREERDKVKRLAQYALSYYDDRLALIDQRIPGIRARAVNVEQPPSTTATTAQTAGNSATGTSSDQEKYDYVFRYRERQDLSPFEVYAQRYAGQAGISVGPHGELSNANRKPIEATNVQELNPTTNSNRDFEITADNEIVASTTMSEFQSNAQALSNLSMMGMKTGAATNNNTTPDSPSRKMRTSISMVLEEPVDLSVKGYGNTSNINATVDPEDINITNMNDQEDNDILIPDSTNNNTLMQPVVQAQGSLLGNNQDAVTATGASVGNKTAATIKSGKQRIQQAAMARAINAGKSPSSATSGQPKRAGRAQYGSLTGTGSGAVGGQGAELEDLIQYLTKTATDGNLRTVVHSFENKVASGEVAQLLTAKTDKDWVFCHLLRQNESHWVPSWCLSKGYYRAEYSHETVCRKGHQLEYLKGPLDGWCLIRNVSKKRTASEWVPVFVLPVRAFEMRPKGSVTGKDNNNNNISSWTSSGSLHLGNLGSIPDGLSASPADEKFAQMVGVDPPNLRVFAAFHRYECKEASIRRGDDLFLLKGPSRGWIKVRINSSGQELFVPYWLLPPNKRPAVDLVSESIVQSQAKANLREMRMKTLNN